MGQDDLPPQIEAKWEEVQLWVWGLAAWRADDGDCWLAIGMILQWWSQQLQKHDIDLDAELLNLWTEWSRPSGKFKDGECETRWRGFLRTDREHVRTLGTLKMWYDEDQAGTEPLSTPKEIEVGSEIVSPLNVPAETLRLWNENLQKNFPKKAPSTYPPKIIEHKPPPVATLDGLIKTAGAKCGGIEVKRWFYRDRDGIEVLCVVRFKLTDGNKAYRQFTKTESTWCAKGLERNCPLYRLPEILKTTADEWVAITEGEKAADAAVLIGFVATTSCQGALSPGKTDWTPLAGRKILLLPDNDDAGKSYAAKVIEILARLNPLPCVKVVNLPGLPDAGDLFDFVEARR
jgi:hypothetical protein